MGVVIKDDMPMIGARMSANLPIALRYMLQDIHRTADPITPKDTGDLRMNVLKEVAGTQGKITWKQQYAIYQGRKQFRNYTTPGTGPHFDIVAINKVVPNFKTYLQKSRLIQ